MATVTFIQRHNQSRSALSQITQYIMRSDKTDGGKYVSGQSCTPQLACREFAATREMHHKKSPVWFYHYTQSFSPEEHVSPELAHRIAMEFAEKAWPENEVLTATHVDRDHIHSHFVVNAVCYESGRMLRQPPDTLIKLRKISDEVCRNNGLSVLEDPSEHGSGIGTREYRSAVKGESWKFQVINAVDFCMACSLTKDEFVRNMERLGYCVRWESGRKNITYTHPGGKKVRDEKLHEEKYLKVRMEDEFRIRAEIISRGTTPPEFFTGGCTSDINRKPNNSGDAEPSYKDSGKHRQKALRDSEFAEQQSFSGRYKEASEDDGEPEVAAATGWEKERAEAFAAAPAEAVMEMASGTAVIDPALGVLLWLGDTLADVQNVPIADSTTRPAHIDSKQWRQEKEKKIALGQKEDDKEEGQQYGMSL